jgi:hypothetical protein
MRSTVATEAKAILMLVALGEPRDKPRDHGREHTQAL